MAMIVFSALVNASTVVSIVRSMPKGSSASKTLARILILDEPTRGVDVGAKTEIHKLMNDLARQGLAIVMISSELPEVLGMSDRVLVMGSGRVVTILDRADATPDAVGAAMMRGAEA